MEEVEACWEWYHTKANTDDPHDIDELDDDETEWDVPSLMFPWSRENQHEEKPVKPLFQTCAFWRYVDERVSVVAVHHSYGMIMSYEINSEYMLQYPAALVEQQC